MEHQAPPFFKTGPTPLARLLIFSALSAALLVADARFSFLIPLRQVAAAIVYPLQRIAAAPASIVQRIGDFFATHSSLREENARLAQENFSSTARLQQLNALAAENAQLRALIAARERLEVKALAAEVLYTARDPFSRKVIIDKGLRDDVKAGQAVVDDRGVVGQVTRIYPWHSEVTLITDKGQLVPVQNLRNGLRAVLAGTGNDGALELRFVPLNADFQNEDALVTSGIDGIYPPGLPVARVTHVERNAAQLFARITCTPVAGVASHTQLLVVTESRELPPRPADEPRQPRARKPRKG
ncbi:MAG: rod shape-determining protein MreC [Betaproteobacteria bacterium RIFCSPLOWO2_02_FULL_67_26]|nr:MAG: rod shape-determining protein MreC [Betaproteobacteria bacterium RIFCSPLOWO2_02_FULL_67_26]